jgi:hypothetical protein
MFNRTEIPQNFLSVIPTDGGLIYNYQQGTCKELAYGKREWRDLEGALQDYVDPNNGKIYAAISYPNGSEKRYQKGLLHSDKGPAVVWRFATGSHLEFYHNGQLHNETGPAVITNRELRYYAHGVLNSIKYHDGRSSLEYNGRSIHLPIKVLNDNFEVIKSAVKELELENYTFDFQSEPKQVGMSL